MAQNRRMDRRAWPTGVLTEAVIMKDVKRGGLPQALLYSVAAVVLGAAAWPVLTTSSDMDLKTIALLVGTGILVVLAVREWMGVTAKVEYRIEEDRIVSKEMQITYEDKDAELTNMATRVPVLQLEKHGSYRIDAAHMHSGYREYELFHLLDEGEEVYIVYSQKTGKLLYIYRKKYWSLPE